MKSESFHNFILVQLIHKYFHIKNALCKKGKKVSDCNGLEIHEFRGEENY